MRKLDVNSGVVNDVSGPRFKSPRYAVNALVRHEVILAVFSPTGPSVIRQPDSADVVGNAYRVHLGSC